MFNYFLYGLNISSDLLLFNIPRTTADHHDATIRKGIVSFDNVPAEDANFYVCDSFAVMRFESGHFRISEGKEIIYSVEDGFTDESVSPFIVGWGMALLLTQRGHSCFHCSALTRSDKCFFVSGISGAGKSTTALELIKHGCKYLADDMAIIDSYENMIVPPAFPVQKVCQDVSLKLNNDLLYSINNDRGKYSYFNHEDYCDTPRCLNTLFVLLLDDIDDVRIEEVTGVWKYMKVLECLYLSLPYYWYSIPDVERFRCLKIAGNIRVFTITRPKGKDTLGQITNGILKILDEQGD